MLTAAGFPIWRELVALIVLQPIPGAPGKTPLGAARPVHYDKGSLRAGAREKDSRVPRLTDELMICSGRRVAWEIQTELIATWGNAPGFIMPKKTVNAEGVIHFWHRRTSELSHRLAILRAKDVLISTSGMFGINPSWLD
jgi:hypothetical protein